MGRGLTPSIHWCQINTRARYRIRSAQRECRLENGVVRLLLHEKRNVLECVVVVHAEAGAHEMIAMAGQMYARPTRGLKPLL